MSLTTDSTPIDESGARALRTDAVARTGRHGEPGRNGMKKKLLLGALLGSGGILVIIGISTLAGDLGQPDQALIYHTVTRSDLPITVTERGNLESQNNIDIVCEVDDIPGDNVNGTPVLQIVPNGSSVKEGDLLVTLDDSSHRERLDRQIVDTEKARSDSIQAKAKFDNQITQNQTLEAEAKLKVELAKLNLLMFEDEEKGTHRLEVEEMNRLVEDINNQILEAQANLELAKNDMQGIESLFKLGYKGKSELDRSRLEYLQAESQYAARLNKLKTQLATLEKKKHYERQMEELTLKGALTTAERSLTQVVRDNEALLEQAKAAMVAAEESLKKEEEMLARYRAQVQNCKVYAPADGMVAYAVPEHRWHAEVRQGAPVSPKQRIISLPNLQRMQVKTAVHESVLDQVKAGLPVTVRVDAFSNRSYRGSVRSVAVLPDQEGWMSSDTKVYETVVTVDEDVEQLKPGMTAVVEIHIDRLKNVLSVPVQAVVQIDNETWCYRKAGGSVERCLIELGRTNDKFVEIRKGIAEGDQVVLNPMSLVEETRQEQTPLSADEGSEPAAEDFEPEVAPPERPRGVGGQQTDQPGQAPLPNVTSDRRPETPAAGGSPRRGPGPPRGGPGAAPGGGPGGGSARRGPPGGGRPPGARPPGAE
ncbi:MAG: efflux RND transporter periplasmic adaptor subunit [Pirellulales bacterium]|nr:efflux RND transporter periplasmic adaptor subunit [Pirellulales bacterium]